MLDVKYFIGVLVIGILLLFKYNICVNKIICVNKKEYIFFKIMSWLFRFELGLL